MPEGVGGQMLADSFRQAGVQPKAIRVTGITNEPTLNALTSGQAPADTVMGKAVTKAVNELGGRVVGWTSQMDIPTGTTWIQANIEYP